MTPNRSDILRLIIYFCRHACMHAHPCRCPFYGPLDFVWHYSGELVPDPIWILLKQETVSGSGISSAIWKSAPFLRQVTMPAPHHSVFYRPHSFPATHPTASKHWRHVYISALVINCFVDEAVIRKPVGLHEQTVRDAQGRLRFHGAFTGGFSAGYFNTVGSKEGKIHNNSILFLSVTDCTGFDWMVLTVHHLLSWCFVMFLPHDAEVTRYMLSWCVCVCLSITHRYCVKMAKCRIMQTLPCDSPVTVVFWRQKSLWNLNGVNPKRGARCS